MDLGLKDKVAVITGGSVGIGLAVAEGPRRRGRRSRARGARRERARDEAAAIAGRIRRARRARRVRRRDAAKDGRPDRRDEQAFGGADILINNAGTGSNETMMEAPDEKWQNYWDLHVMAAVRLARGLAPLMKARGGGVILHNASICATQPLGYEPIYNITKAALMMFSKCLANELVVGQHPRQLRQPGPDPHARLDQDRKATDGRQRRRLGGPPAAVAVNMRRSDASPPAELANFFVFLCSDRASYSVGSTYFVDGGMHKSV